MPWKRFSRIKDFLFFLKELRGRYREGMPRDIRVLGENPAAARAQLGWPTGKNQCSVRGPEHWTDRPGGQSTPISHFDADLNDDRSLLDSLGYCVGRVAAGGFGCLTRKNEKHNRLRRHQQSVRYTMCAQNSILRHVRVLDLGTRILNFGSSAQVPAQRGREPHIF